MAKPQPVSVATLKAIADAFNAHDLDAIMEFFAEDCSLDMPRGPEPWGPWLRPLGGSGREGHEEGVVLEDRGAAGLNASALATG